MRNEMVTDARDAQNLKNERRPFVQMRESTLVVRHRHKWYLLWLSPSAYWIGQVKPRHGCSRFATRLESEGGRFESSDCFPCRRSSGASGRTCGCADTRSRISDGKPPA